MTKFYMIAQNKADTSFDAVQSDIESGRMGVPEIVSLVQTRTSFPHGRKIRCKWENGELSGRVVPDCSQEGNRARTVLFYSRVNSVDELGPEYWQCVVVKLKELLGNEISDERAHEFAKNLKKTVDGDRGRVKKVAAFFIVALVVLIVLLMK